MDVRGAWVQLRYPGAVPDPDSLASGRLASVSRGAALSSRATASHGNEVVEACGRKGVQAVVVISAGFKETGGEGVERERALVEIARRHGMRLVGPNCLGVLNTEAHVRMDATFAPTYPPAGTVA